MERCLRGVAMTVAAITPQTPTRFPEVDTAVASAIAAEEALAASPLPGSAPS